MPDPSAKTSGDGIEMGAILAHWETLGCSGSHVNELIVGMETGTLQSLQPGLPRSLEMPGNRS